ncbi:MAG: hypothetical protein KC609_22415 [Myxococcales bacterium]|nr:hypothetical protein [Myxococcales bacterium]
MSDRIRRHQVSPRALWLGSRAAPLFALMLAAGCGPIPADLAPPRVSPESSSYHEARSVVIDTFAADGRVNRLVAERGRFDPRSGFLELTQVDMRFVAPRRSSLPVVSKGRGTHRLLAPSAVGNVERREFHIFGPAVLETPSGDRLQTMYAWYIGLRSMLILPAGGLFSGSGRRLRASVVFFLEKEAVYELFDVHGTFRRLRKKDQ